LRWIDRFLSIPCTDVSKRAQSGSERGPVGIGLPRVIASVRASAALRTGNHRLQVISEVRAAIVHDAGCAARAGTARVEVIIGAGRAADGV
jgi:hypothetical protein